MTEDNIIQKSENEVSEIKKITDLYFEPKKFENKLYKIIGVDFYNKKLWAPTWGKLSKILGVHDGKWIKDNSSKSLEEYFQDTKRGESWHLLYTLGVYSFLGFTPEAHAINTIVNFYPIMIQRYNRGRVSSILKKRLDKKVGKLNN